MTCDKCKCDIPINAFINVNWVDGTILCVRCVNQTILEEAEEFTNMMETANNATEFYIKGRYDY